MVSLKELKFDYWVAARSVAAMRADLADAEKELSRLRDELAAAVDEDKRAAAIASARARCGPVVVA